MKRYSRSDQARRGISVGISLLMLTLSVAVPVLERGSFFDRPIVEREHNPGDCPSGHDHTVCTQVGANLSLEAASILTELGSAVVTVSPLAAKRVYATGPVDGERHSRAPPLA
jgi:hypothetical protein